jgi:hypothetical protein
MTTRVPALGVPVAAADVPADASDADAAGVVVIEGAVPPEGDDGDGPPEP